MCGGFIQDLFNVATLGVFKGEEEAATPQQAEIPDKPLRANREKADASIASAIKSRRAGGQKPAKLPSLLTPGGAQGISDTQLNLGKSLLGG